MPLGKYLKLFVLPLSNSTSHHFVLMIVWNCLTAGVAVSPSHPGSMGMDEVRASRPGEV